MYSTFQKWSNLDVFLCAQDCDGNRLEIHFAWYLAAISTLCKCKVIINSSYYFRFRLLAIWQKEMTRLCAVILHIRVKKVHILQMVGSTGQAVENPHEAEH